jgi:hypothetical protein
MEIEIRKKRNSLPNLPPFPSQSAAAAQVAKSARSRRSRVVGSLIHGPDWMEPRSKPPAGQTPRNRSAPPDLDPTGQIRSYRFNRAFLQIKPWVSSKLQPGPSTLGKSLHIGHVFFSLARKLNFYLQNSPKTCFRHNFVVLAPFLAFFMSTRSSRRVERLFPLFSFVSTIWWLFLILLHCMLVCEWCGA